MAATLSSFPFIEKDRSTEYSGQFAGFFRDVFGYWQLVLRSSEGELFFQVRKTLRKELAKTLAPGQELVVLVRAEAGHRDGPLVEQVRTAGESFGIVDCVRVCSKKHCWRNGGKAVWATLKDQIAENDLTASLQLEEVDCLDHCKMGPNIEWNGQLVENCSPVVAREILDAYRLQGSRN